MAHNVELTARIRTLKELDLLVNQQLVNLCKILEARRNPGDRRRCRHELWCRPLCRLTYNTHNNNDEIKITSGHSNLTQSRIAAAHNGSVVLDRLRQCTPK